MRLIKKNHQSSNGIIRDILENFFTSIFDKESEHIKKLLRNKETMVLLILNRGVNKENGSNLEIENIVAGVMFCSNKFDGILIDFLCAAGGYHGYGYGTLLLHFAQVFGREQITKECKKQMAKEVITCLACRTSLIPYYKNLGFKTHQYEDFLSRGRFSGFGKRIEINDWKEKDDMRLRCMSIDEFVPRYLNIISHDKFGVEKSLYNESLMTSFKNFNFPSNMTQNYHRRLITKLKL